MATAAQVKANRENAQHSTGPRTEEGKNATRYNAYKHGVLRHWYGNRVKAWPTGTAFLDEYVADKAPAGLPQILCIEQAALAEFKIMRLPDFETFQARQVMRTAIHWTGNSKTSTLMTDKCRRTSSAAKCT